MQQKTLNQRYELERKIGEGGMARVYRGRDLRLNRPIAVKVLHPHYSADANFLARFHHEAQAAANLRHPNVVDVYDVGQDGDVHYIVMEFVDGQDLKALILQQGPLPIEQAVLIARAVAEGLDAAHRVGLVHRDIKPQNIIVGADGQVKITDFGIAKSGLSTSATETGVIFGTADYLSPEQARGQTATVLSDVYALGVTLFEMLTGRLPFSGESSIAVAMQHVSEDPPPPSMFNARIPQQLEALVLRALSKDPARRPASAREFAQLLTRYQQAGGEATMVRPVPPRPNMPPGPQPNPRTNTPPGPQPNPRNPRTSQTRPQPTLPPRPVITTPPPNGSGMGFGGFLLGLLLIGGVLGLVALFMSGTFNDLLGSIGSSPTRPPAATAVVASTAGPTGVPTSTPAPQVPMPNLLGATAQDAERLVREARLFPLAGDPRYSDTFAAGQVLDQWPRPGSLITETTVVTYALSLGPDAVALPDLTGQAANSARAQLEVLGFRVEVQRRPNDQFDRDFVITTSPRPPARPPRGSTVTLIVSNGDFVVMPDVFKLSLDEARQRIEAAGLFVSFVDEQGPEKLGDQFNQFAPGQVVSSDPRGGTEVRRGSGVNLGVRAP
ncbi:MAG: Stk1 family PASTA domain-containing Ser/Thr kinase [Roseiflexaceae bacterium]